ncbi:hypothetical protein V5O48_016472 [Marasmius crinis-equi]|uniref:Uncharacterized protein n=1 Tax=Marasmius crinis-equi TaxID=585013 RepID=A0ABR3ERL8_9AGAR
MRDYQIMRQFDPTTDAFARHCGTYDFVFDPVETPLTTDPSRFEELNVAEPVVVEHETREDLEDIFAYFLALFGDAPVEDDTPEPAELSRASV